MQRNFCSAKYTSGLLVVCWSNLETRIAGGCPDPSLVGAGAIWLIIWWVATTLWIKVTITNKRTVDTTVIVDDGEILVLGGLLEDVLRESDQRVPVLGRIPLLGNLLSELRPELDLYLVTDAAVENFAKPINSP